MSLFFSSTIPELRSEFWLFLVVAERRLKGDEFEDLTDFRPRE